MTIGSGCWRHAPAPLLVTRLAPRPASLPHLPHSALWLWHLNTAVLKGSLIKYLFLRGHWFLTNVDFSIVPNRYRAQRAFGTQPFGFSTVPLRADTRHVRRQLTAHVGSRFQSEVGGGTSTRFLPGDVHPLLPVPSLCSPSGVACRGRPVWYWVTALSGPSHLGSHSHRVNGPAQGRHPSRSSTNHRPRRVAVSERGGWRYEHPVPAG